MADHESVSSETIKPKVAAESSVIRVAHLIVFNENYTHEGLIESIDRVSRIDL